MNKDLFLDGERFISVKRGAEITGYSEDYVGQLCRLGRVNSRMVGRTWYVSKRSLLTYKKLGNKTEEAPKEILKQPPKKNLSLNGDKYVSTKEAAKEVGYTEDYIGQLCRGGTLECRRVGRSWYVSRKSILNHKRANIAKELSLASAPKPLTLPKPKVFVPAKYESESLSILPKLIEKTTPIKLNKSLFLSKALISSLGTILIVGSSLNLLNQLSPTLEEKIQDQVASSQLASIAFLDNIRDLFFGKKEEKTIITTPAPIIQQQIFQTTPLDINALKREITAEIQNFIKNQPSAEPITITNYQTYQNPIIVKHVYETISRQSQRDVDLMSRAISGVTDNGLLVNPTITYATISDSSFSGTLTFSRASGAEATSTNFFATTLNAINASTTNLLFNLATGTSATTTNLFSTLGVFNTLNLNQLTNGSTMFKAQRVTDTAPSGDFISYLNAAGNTQLFRVDNSGNIYAGGITNSGALTITSISTPQFRVQYDASNESTSSVSSAGVTTYGFNGTTPRAIWTPQSNRTDSFIFQNSSAFPILIVDTTNNRVNIQGLASTTNLLVAASSTLQNFTFLNATGTNATSTNFFSTTASSTNLFTSLLKVGDGSVSLPSLSFTNDTNTGIYRVGTDEIGITVAGVQIADFQPGFAFILGSTLAVSGASGTASSPALRLTGTNGLSTMGLYVVGNDRLGISTAGLARWEVDSGGHLLTATDNTYDIGASGATRPRNLFVGTGITTANLLTTSSTTLQNFTFINATGTSATTTNFYTSGQTILAGVSGNVGIGTTIPNTKFQVTTNDSTAYNASPSQGQNDVGATIKIFNPSETDNSFSQILFGNRQSGFGIARIVSEVVSGGDNVNLRFVVEGLGVPTERMVIMSTGNVGIGTTGPGNKLEILTDDSATNTVLSVLKLSHTTTGTGATGLGAGMSFFSERATGGLNLERAAIYGIAGADSEDDGDLAFYTRKDTGAIGVNEKMRITSDGNVGIGTTSPTFSSGFFGLHLSDFNAEAIDPTIRLSDTGSGLGHFEIRSTRVSSGNMLQFGEGTATFMTIRSDDDLGTTITRGYVGIGTTTPQEKLSIDGADTALRITGSTRAKIILQPTVGGSLYKGWQIDVPAETGNVPGGYFGIIESGVGTRLTIASSTGNVGIGTTNPSTNKLSVVTTAGTVAVNTESDGGYRIALRPDQSGVGDIMSAKSGAIGTQLSFTTQSSAGSTIERMRIDSAGNVGIGDTTPDFLLDVETASNVNVVEINNTNSSQTLKTLTLRSTTTNVGNNYSHLEAFSNSTTQVFRLLANGNVENLNNSYGALSDLKLKENIADAPATLGLFNKVRVVNYTLKNDPTHSYQVGMIAQELEEVFPELVYDNKDRDDNGNELGTVTKGITYSRFVPLLIKSVQELNFKIDTIASTTFAFQVPTSTPGFIASVLESIGATIVDGITHFVKLAIDTLTAKEVRTDKLCVEDVCVTREQFLAIVSASSVSTPTPPPASIPEPTPTPAPEPAPEVIPEPAPVADTISSTPTP